METPTALVALLREAGIPLGTALALEAILDARRDLGVGSDHLADVLLRWKCQQSRRSAVEAERVLIERLKRVFEGVLKLLAGDNSANMTIALQRLQEQLLTEPELDAVARFDYDLLALGPKQQVQQSDDELH